MKIFRIGGLIALALCLMSGTQAKAGLITFTASGVAGVSGFVQLDDSSFDGSTEQTLPNTIVTDLSLTVFGVTYNFGDVVTGDETIIDSSGLLPLIVNGSGLLADDGAGHQIAFFPDGYNGTAFDGDASLAFGSNVFGTPGVDVDFYPVAWVTGATAPEPTTLAILGLGLTGLGLMRRKRAA